MAHNARTFSSRTWIAVGVVGIILLVAFAFVREYVRNIDIATELARMEQENASLNTQHLASLQLIAQLSTETEVEEEARSKMNLAKQGEKMYVVSDTDGTDGQSMGTDGGEAAVAVNVATDPALSNPVKWFYYFFAPASEQEAAHL